MSTDPDRALARVRELHDDPGAAPYDPEVFRPAGADGADRDRDRAAATAPSGANLQPWRFVVVTDPERKRRIRAAAETEEREFEVHKGPTSPRPYYCKESVGIAVGFLLAALHRAGLATLTRTSPARRCPRCW